MRLLATAFLWKIMVIALALSLGACGLPDAPPVRGAPDAKLLLAQSHWQARRPARYRLMVQEDTASRSCRQTIEVHDERVQAVLEDHCGRSAGWTVSSLLDWIGESAQSSSACDPTTMICACYIHEATNAVYDPRLGYPYVLSYQRSSSPNWNTLNLWWRIWGSAALPDCARGAGANAQKLTIRVISLTALP